MIKVKSIKTKHQKFKKLSGKWAELRKLLGEGFANDEKVKKLMGINRNLFKEKLYNKLTSKY